MNKLQEQKDRFNQIYTLGSRRHVLSNDVATRYIVSWRVEESIRRLISSSLSDLKIFTPLVVDYIQSIA